MKSVRTRLKALFLSLLIAGLLSVTWSAALAGPVAIAPDPAAPDTVKSDGLCSLREAIIAANKDADSTDDCVFDNSAATISLFPGATYTLTKDDNGQENSSSSGDLDITASLTIEGNGATIKAEPGFRNRIIHVISGVVDIQNLTITGGSPKRDGGGILNEAELTLTDVTVTGNDSGGNGGGIQNEGTLLVRASTLSGNVAGGDGGAISNIGTLNLANATLSDNSSEGHGGGLFNAAGNASLNNATVANNTADSDDRQGGDGGGIAQASGAVTIGNSLVAYNIDNTSGSQPSDCSGTLDSTGFNLIQVAICSISAVDNLLGADPLLEPLGDNGGTTFTHALSGSSPAIDAGNPASVASGPDACESSDQRGVSRPLGLACDIGAYESELPSTPVLIRVVGVDLTGSGGASVDGLVAGFENSNFTLSVFTGTTCDEALNSTTPFETALITTDADGYFFADLDSDIIVDPLEPVFVVANITDSRGKLSGRSECVVASLGNDSWPTALPLSGSPISHQQYLDTFGQSLWFKFTAQPGSQLIVTLTDLPINYDLTIYKDIGAAYDDLTTTEDLERLSAEFAPSAFSPSAFSPSAFSPSAFSPSAFSPSAFSPSAFSPSAFSPSAFSPSAFSPSAFSPSAFSPSAFSPSAFSPDAWSPSAFSPSAFSPSAFSPSAFSPSAFSPSAFSPSAFSAAQSQSLIGVSAFDGNAGEGLVLNTWNNTGDFYVRVRGREGAFSLDAPFTLGIVVQAGTCGSVSTSLPSTSHSRIPGSYKTVILTDMDRMEGSATEKNELTDRLNTLAARTEVQGIIVDVSTDNRVQQANVQADANRQCPFAKNLVADAIRSIVDLYRSPDLQYVVLIGGDGAIPFFRHPDEALLGPENQYVPPVLDSSASQASLRLNYVLSQEDYGAKFSVSYGNDEIPIPDLAVGRLVETVAEATGMIDAYLLTGSEEGGTPGVIPTPTTSLVTGYDFLQDAADAIQSEFASGLGGGTQTDTLIAPNNISPEDPLSWDADDLANSFLGSRHDLVFLAGHFSASSALAADYRTSLTTLDMLESEVNLTNSIVFSAGCHSGYNIVNADGVPFVTFEPDWAQAFAQKGATLIAGTGYQYGDTEFLEYSERIYLEFARQLRAGAGSVSVGDALVASKQIYLANTPQMRGIHAKAFLEATLFGLPMLSVDMPGVRYTAPSLAPTVGSTIAATSNPGSTLGLRYADLTVSPNFVDHTLQLNNYDDNSTVEAFYLSGSDGVVSNPSEPTLPLELRNVSVAGTVLRGVGFLGGSYSDLHNILPLSGAPTTEIRGVHTPFVTSIFYPVRPWGVNYFDTLSSNGDGITQLAVTPAQFRSAPMDLEKGTLRKFSSLNLRLYYSSFTDADEQSGQSALAAPPTIVSVSSSVNGQDIQFRAQVVDNPAAGIQEVWVTYTDISNPSGGTWQSISLTQDAVESTLWEGSLSVTNPGGSRYIVQATNGLGLVTMATNLGSYYIPGAEAGQGEPTSLAMSGGTPGSGKFGTQVSVSATLTDINGGIAGKVVTFFLGSVGRVAVTNGSGTATATLPVLALPGENEVVAFFAGDADRNPSGSSSPFSIQKRDTQLALVDLEDPPGGFAIENFLIQATLSEAFPDGRTLPEQTIVFNVTSTSATGGSYSRAVITDYLGRAELGEIPLPPGDYTVEAFFSGSGHGHDFSHEDDRYNPSSASLDLFTLTNSKPEGLPDAYSLDEDTPLITIVDEILSIDEGVLANDSDVDDQQLTAILDTSIYVTGAANGAVILNLDGSFTYAPDVDFNGIDNFTYFVNDTIENSDPVAVELTVNSVNDIPEATDDSYEDDEDSILAVAGPGLLDNDTDADFGDVPQDTLKAVIETDPSNGGLVLNEDGSFSYTPDADFNGVDTFTYHVEDLTQATSNIATVTITVIAINDAPVAGDDAYSIDEDKTLTVGAPGVLGTDSDIDGDGLGTVLINDVSNGTLSLSADGSFTYTPVPNFNGSDAFTYKASDGLAQSAMATVTINVSAMNDAPAATNDSYTVDEDNTLAIGASGVLGNDSDVDGDQLSAALVDNVSNGTLALDSDGSFSYTPLDNFFGTVTFTYKASDGLAQSALATVSIDVTAVNDVPVAEVDNYPAFEDTPLGISAPGVLGNDSDVEGSLLTASIASRPGGGLLVLNSDGSFTYTPNPDFNGTDWFTYVANDATSESAAATVTIIVSAVNDAPAATNDSYTVDEDNTLIVGTPGVLGNDSDVDGDALTAILEDDVPSGSLALNADGSFSYSPVENFFGTVTFTYKASDGALESNVATVTINVLSVNDLPNCSTATPSIVMLWPVDGKMESVTISGATDPDGDDSLITYVVTVVFQDEPVGKRPDAQIFNNSDTVKVRSERDGNGDGRVYHIMFIATDEQGSTCDGEVRVATVPHDQGGEADIDLIDGGPLYDSELADR